MNKRILPPVYFYILLLGLGAAHFVIPIACILHPPWTYIGVFLILAGIVINIKTDRLLTKHNTTVKPHEKPSSLIVSGPFHFSRHPMYLGMTAILLGGALISGALSAFFMPAVFVLVMEVLFIPTEERTLEEQFGEDYRKYTQNVRRWI